MKETLLQVPAREVENLFKRAFSANGLEFGPYRIDLATLHEHVTDLTAENPTEIADEVISGLLSETLADVNSQRFGSNGEVWYLPEGTKVTETMVRDRATMRAFTARLCLTPSPEVDRQLKGRTEDLFARDLLFSLPFLDLFELTYPDMHQPIHQRVRDTISTDDVIGTVFLASLGNYREGLWVSDYSLLAATNPTTAKRLRTPNYSGEYFWFERKPWSAEVMSIAMRHANLPAYPNPPIHNEIGYVYATHVEIAAD